MTASIETQAGSVSNALAAIEEINSSIHNMAKVAGQKKEIADSMLTVAQSGYNRMNELSSASGEIVIALDENMQSLARASSRVVQNMTKITVEIDGKREAVDEISGTGKRNEANLDALGERVNHFQT